MAWGRKKGIPAQCQICNLLHVTYWSWPLFAIEFTMENNPLMHKSHNVTAKNLNGGMDLKTYLKLGIFVQ